MLQRVLSDQALRRDFPKLRFTADPKGRAMIGCSQGGEQAMIAGFFRPDLVGVVMAYSATVVWHNTAHLCAIHCVIHWQVTRLAGPPSFSPGRRGRGSSRCVLMFERGSHSKRGSAALRSQNQT